MQDWNVKRILDWAIEYFNSKIIPQPRLSAELLLSSVVGLDRINLYLNYDRVLDKQELAAYKKYILQRLQHVPVQYILNEAFFRRIKLYVDDNVLVPRPETELVVEKAIAMAREAISEKGRINILEIGTGSGAIAISLAQEIDEKPGAPAAAWKIIATDNSAPAVEIARRNASSILGSEKSSSIEFIHCDLVPGKDSDFFYEFEKSIDLIISNPPYIPENDFKNLPREVKDYEPRAALVAGKTGLEIYKNILDKVMPYFSEDKSYIIFEIDSEAGSALKKLAKDVLGPAEIIIEKDYNQKDRILTIIK